MLEAGLIQFYTGYEDSASLKAVSVLSVAVLYIKPSYSYASMSNKIHSGFFNPDIIFDGVTGRSWATLAQMSMSVFTEK